MGSIEMQQQQHWFQCHFSYMSGRRSNGRFRRPLAFPIAKLPTTPSFFRKVLTEKMRWIDLCFD